MESMNYSLNEQCLFSVRAIRPWRSNEAEKIESHGKCVGRGKKTISPFEMLPKLKIIQATCCRQLNHRIGGKIHFVVQ